MARARLLGSTKCALVCLALLLGCDRRDEAPPAPSAPPAAPALPGLQASLDGKALPLRSVVAYSRGGAALHLSFSTHPITCKDVGGEGTVRLAGETTLDVTIAPRLQPDGGSDWRVMRARLGAVTRQGDLGSARVSAFDPRKTVEAAIDLAVDFPPPAPHALKLAGRIRAEGCGLRPYSLEAKVRPQPDLRVEIAGRRILIHGASLTRRPNGDLSLLFTSEPHACAIGARGSDHAVTLQLGPAGETKRARIEGYGFPRVLDHGGDGIAVRFDSKADSRLALELAGTTEIGGYRLLLDGSAELESCPETPARP